VKKKILYAILILGALTIAMQLLVGFPLVIVSSEVSVTPTVSDTLKKDDVIEPIKNIDISSGNNSVYILFSRDDFKELPANIPHKKLIKIDEADILKEFQNQFRFSYSGGDMATMESTIFFFNNGNLIFKSKLLIGKERVGLQNQFGWIEAIEPSKLIEIIGKSKPVYSPIVFI
jgi:hypothetical protein